MSRDPGKSLSFTLRFRNNALPDALRVVAKVERKSMNALIEEMIERELPREVAAVEADLSRTLAALRGYKGDGGREWKAFAEAEGTVEEPIEASRLDDPHGVKAAFG